jgi:hypothetical protein
MQSQMQTLTAAFTNAQVRSLEALRLVEAMANEFSQKPSQSTLPLSGNTL